VLTTTRSYQFRGFGLRRPTEHWSLPISGT
jgi:hypothetical protein